MTQRTVLLGYEIGTGSPVEIPVMHLAVTGQTQQSGKTTTLEALVHRSGLRAIAFVTKRAEGSFQNARRIQPYFRERADWQFVSAVLEATLREKMKFERSWIMRVCKGASTLRDVRENVHKALPKARGLSEDVYFRLGEYLDLVIPQMKRTAWASTVDLQPGLNVMYLAEFTSEVQALVIRSVLEWIHDRERDTIVVIPEAWEFIPEGRGSPVKLAAEKLIRKGAAAGNYVWLDSQDIAGVDKVLLKQVAVWILGVQRADVEVKRTLAHLPAGAARPKPADIMQLNRGEFFVSYGRELKCVYVMPAWMDENNARNIALGNTAWHRVEPAPADDHDQPDPEIEPYEPMVQCGQPERDRALLMEEEMENKARKEIERLQEFIAQELPHEPGAMNRETAVDCAIRLLKERRPNAQVKPCRVDATDTDSIVAEVIRRLQSSDSPLLKLTADKPELEVTVQRRTIEADGSTLRGRLAALIAEDYFQEAKTGNSAFNELKRRGVGTAKPNVYRELDKLAEWGFLTKELAGGYQAVAGMKVNIREVA
jgi:hypothetical protein